jgi:hypothetical protein
LPLAADSFVRLRHRIRLDFSSPCPLSPNIKVRRVPCSVSGNNSECRKEEKRENNPTKPSPRHKDLKDHARTILNTPTQIRPLSLASDISVLRNSHAPSCLLTDAAAAPPNHSSHRIAKHETSNQFRVRLLFPSRNQRCRRLLGDQLRYLYKFV